MARFGCAAALLLGTVCGCQPELSVVEGVSARPAKYQGWGQSGTGMLWGHTLLDLGVRSMSRRAVMPRERVLSFVDSERRYDVEIFGADRGGLLRRLLAETFGVVARREVREIDVLVLAADPAGVRLAAPETIGEPDVRTRPLQLCRHGLSSLFPPRMERTTHTFASCRMVQLAAWLEPRYDRLVIDETGQPGTYDFILVEDPENNVAIEESLAAIGLELRPARRRVAAIYVDITGSSAPVRVRRLKTGYKKSPLRWNPE